MISPYKDLPPEKWLAVTNQLIERHPLKKDEIVQVVLVSWDSIFASKMGSSGFQIGKEIFPRPQIMGFFLHELIPLELAARHPDSWRRDLTSGEKDIVFVPDDQYSIEVKTSSNPKQIFGNRSYAQEATENKKAKSGYYLTVNFEKFSEDIQYPKILLIRFGWLDASDWIGQKAATGQQSHIPSEVYNYKLVELYEHQ